MVHVQLPGCTVNQVEAAEVLGCSPATVSRICSGERTPSLDLMYEIRRVLAWSVQQQADEVRAGTYAQMFKRKMEARRVRGRMRRPRGRVVEE